MIEVLLNAIKILVSEDTRKTASSLVELVHRSPEWQKDICVIEAYINRAASEQAYLLRNLTIEKMQALGYSVDSVSAFQYCFGEMAHNAFEYGCGRDRSARIKIVIEITRGYVALTVINDHKIKFDFEKALNHQINILSQNPTVRRGRGLLTIYDLADTVSGLQGKDGIKAAFYNPSVLLKTYHLDGLNIIAVLAGIFNPSVNRRIMREVQTSPASALIVWLPGIPPTAVISHMLDLYLIYRQIGKPMVVLLDRQWGTNTFHLNLLPQSMIAHTWDEALYKIGRPELSGYVRKLTSD